MPPINTRLHIESLVAQETWPRFVKQFEREYITNSHQGSALTRLLHRSGEALIVAGHKLEQYAEARRINEPSNSYLT